MASDPLQQLANLFIKFPGIGGRQAKRFAYFLVNQDPEFIKELTFAITDVRQRVSQCRHCFRLYTKNASEAPVCNLCSDPERDHTTLLIVEKDPDLNAVEKTGIYKGDYFVLGGLLPLLEEKESRHIRSGELVAAVTER
ncbi:MAG TPA: toprim domain-containing protein, partial [Candidatus Paceibacterota bacterium]|nr:toprim domain-containing protein [Candidatus Paceibacterota bacterium]